VTAGPTPLSLPASEAGIPRETHSTYPPDVAEW
jgi:hypothetical protein